jgi:hypothetical protein
MTESLPRPGDDETHNATTEQRLSTEPLTDRAISGTSATEQVSANRDSAVSGDRDRDRGEPDNASEAMVEGADREGNGGDDEGEEDADEEQDEDEDEEDDDEEEEEDEEPKLKYARLTQHLGPVYRNGDATSAFLVAGDKMVRLPQHSMLLLVLRTY